MSNVSYVELKRYLPPAVKNVLTIGGSSWIGEVDATTVLKYPHDRGEENEVFETESKILNVFGKHPRIIELKAYTDDGLYLERAINGDLYEYLKTHLSISIQQRLTCCRQTAEAVAYAHSKRVIHCDIRPRNLLLDDNLDLKLADFQGEYLSAEEEVLLNGFASEPCKFSCPRQSADHADVKTDLFALGSTIYCIIMGHEVFPDLIGDDDATEEEVQCRFLARQYPSDSHACSVITTKCWDQVYNSAMEVLDDIDAIVNLNKYERQAGSGDSYGQEGDQLRKEWLVKHNLRSQIIDPFHTQ